MQGPKAGIAAFLYPKGIIIFLSFFFSSTVFSQQFNTWQATIHGGISQISGDVSARSGIGGGFMIQRNLSPVFGLSADYTGSLNYGLDIKLRTSAGINDNSPSDPWHYIYGPNKLFVANYKSAIHQFSVNGVANIFQRNLSANSQKLNLYAKAGYSLVIADVSIDPIGGNGQPYDFTNINFNATRKEIRNQLNQLRDGRYERIAYYKNMPSSSPKSLHTYHGVNAGVGINLSFTEKLGLGLEYRLTANFSDYLDGIKSGGNDMMHYTSLRLNYNFGRSTTKAAKRTRSDGSKSIVTAPEVITTVSAFVEPVVKGEAIMKGADTSYYLDFNFVSAVPGNVTTQHMVFLKLDNKEIISLPYIGIPSPVRAGTSFTFRTKVPAHDVRTLASTNVTDIKIETSTLSLEDRITNGKQGVIASICRQLLR